jgi:hypothetical protein
MTENYPLGQLDLNESEQKIIKDSVDSIRKVLRTKNRDIRSIIGLVTSGEIADTKAAVEVRFLEEHALNVQMNMVAFD